MPDQADSIIGRLGEIEERISKIVELPTVAQWRHEEELRGLIAEREQIFKEQYGS